MKILVATEKPFAAVAVDGIRKVVEDAGFELELLEKYSAKQELLDAVATADGLIIRSDIVDNEVLDAAKQLKRCRIRQCGSRSSNGTQRGCRKHSRSELQRSC